MNRLSSVGYRNTGVAIRAQNQIDHPSNISESNGFPRTTTKKYYAKSNKVGEESTTGELCLDFLREEDRLNYLGSVLSCCL